MHFFWVLGQNKRFKGDLGEILRGEVEERTRLAVQAGASTEDA